MKISLCEAAQPPPLPSQPIHLEFNQSRHREWSAGSMKMRHGPGCRFTLVHDRPSNGLYFGRPKWCQSSVVDQTHHCSAPGSTKGYLSRDCPRGFPCLFNMSSFQEALATIILHSKVLECAIISTSQNHSGPGHNSWSSTPEFSDCFFFFGSNLGVRLLSPEDQVDWAESEISAWAKT